ncbi:lipoate-protein ligase A [Parabacteroides sp. PFB2-10]|uniref:lipoate--protein ligase family protein n=1 Tax=Parabacteroides sp. PFB2-10 TaxID=1742405 RepID=UPI0024734C9B|nr:lipoate--protein ligase family protein [Parabacteroides sp. PFB2-10]MDH6313194.1 lipoate-protein ligase A [Parabacteroides sp. PFB2-10]
MQIITSPSHDPMYNLSLERELLEEPAGDFLLFYINAPSVIVGRNQAIEAEVDTAFCRAHHIPVLQRISGGGTVYHDEGNINYAFISDRTAVSILDSQPLLPIIDALASFGIRAEAGKRNELLVDGYKVSGTASYVTSKRQLFHGTLLHNTNLDILQTVLRGDSTQRGRKIASVPSPVRNLSHYSSLACETEHFLILLVSFFSSYYSSADSSPNF